MLQHDFADPFEPTGAREKPHQRDIDDEDHQQDGPQTKLSRMDCEATTPFDHMSYRQTHENKWPDDREDYATGFSQPEADIPSDLRQWLGWYHVMTTELVQQVRIEQGDRLAASILETPRPLGLR